MSWQRGLRFIEEGEVDYVAIFVVNNIPEGLFDVRNDDWIEI